MGAIHLAVLEKIHVVPQELLQLAGRPSCWDGCSAGHTLMLPEPFWEDKLPGGTESTYKPLCGALDFIRRSISACSLKATGGEGHI